MAQIRVTILALVAVLGGLPQAELAPRPEPVVSTGEFMDLFMKTAYGELQHAMAHPPQDRKQWSAVYQSAVRLAETENLLFFRDQDDVRDPRWAAFAARGRRAAADVAGAAMKNLGNLENADYDAARAKYVEVSAACNSCHTAFSREAPVIKP